MATLREIRRRITSITNIQQITNAMRMVAAARFRRAQESILAARPYAYKFDTLLRHLASQMEVFTSFSSLASLNRFASLTDAKGLREGHPLLETREVNNVCVIVVTGDRGLCGSFNHNVVRRTISHIERNYSDANVDLICVGRRGRDYFRTRSYNIIAEHVNIFRALDYQYAVGIAAHIATLYTEKIVDRVDVIYNNFRTAITQEVLVEQILPITPQKPEGDALFTEYLYEPTKEAIWETVVPQHLNTQMWRILLDSNAAEQAARMTAMENATNNAKDLISELTLQRNRVRQTMITKEISEIVGGAEALAGARG
jgi:F-type H+-transporting ATPase subunit gamma